MEHEHFSYVEALRWLANKYQIAIKEDREQTAEEIAEISIR
jgi:DNA primase